jgi:hypothetical protein
VGDDCPRRGCGRRSNGRIPRVFWCCREQLGGYAWGVRRIVVHRFGAEPVCAWCPFARAAFSKLIAGGDASAADRSWRDLPSLAAPVRAWHHLTPSSAPTLVPRSIKQETLGFYHGKATRSRPPALPCQLQHADSELLSCTLSLLPSLPDRDTGTTRRIGHSTTIRILTPCYSHCLQCPFQPAPIASTCIGTLYHGQYQVSLTEPSLPEPLHLFVKGFPLHMTHIINTRNCLSL